jgi:hypothetical protein
MAAVRLARLMVVWRRGVENGLLVSGRLNRMSRGIGNGRPGSCGDGLRRPDAAPESKRRSRTLTPDRAAGRGPDNRSNIWRINGNECAVSVS